MPTQIKWKLDRFIKWHFAVPFILLFMLFSALELFRLDLWISGHFYNTELHRWIYQESRLAKSVLHIGGPIIIALLKSSAHSYCPWSLALLAAISLMFGVSLQVRGAHFLSHDVFSLAV